MRGRAGKQAPARAGKRTQREQICTSRLEPIMATESYTIGLGSRRKAVGSEGRPSPKLLIQPWI